MQILPDWLAFGRKPGASPTLGAEWLDDKALDDPLTAAEVMRRQLPLLLAGQHHQAARLKLLESAFEKTRRILPAIEKQVENAPLPLPADALQAALAADNLLKVMAAGYGVLLATVNAQKVPAAASNVGRLATLRSMECLTRRQQLACRAYAPPSANTWQMIHGTYAYAKAQNLAGFSAGGRSVAHDYLVALLLAWADPTKFSRQDFAPLLGCLIHYAPLAKIRPLGGDPAHIDEHAPVFLIHEDDPHAGKRLIKPPRADASGKAWLVDCRTLLAALEQSVAQREQGGARPNHEPATPPTILRALLGTFRSQRARRFARQSFKPRGDLVAGLPALIDALGGGRITEQPATSEWAIVDESPDGFGLRYLRGESNGLQVGELVGLRPRERDRRLHVCLVRRVLNSGASRLELGLQELSPQARAITLRSLQQRAGTLGILFPSLPAWRGVPGVIAPSGALAIDSRVAVGGRELRALRVLEAYSRYELWQLTDQ